MREHCYLHFNTKKSNGVKQKETETEIVINTIYLND